MQVVTLNSLENFVGKTVLVVTGYANFSGELGRNEYGYFVDFMLKPITEGGKAEKYYIKSRDRVFVDDSV